MKGQSHNTVPCCFVRHGETDANAQNLICGADWDIELNAVGHRQAQSAASNIKAFNIEYIVCSPLIRAQQTASYFSKSLRLPVQTIADLREWELGDWSRKPSPDICNFFDAELDPPNGESVAVFHERIIHTVRNILAQYRNPLIVSHGAVWKRLCKHNDMNYKQIPNCQVQTILFRN